MTRVCVQWPRFGPYHLARLRAAHARFAEEHVELIGLETAGDDATYAWRVEAAAEPFRREQVFPGRTFEAIPPHDMAAGITARLDALQPDAVAITSYSYPDARACLAWCRRNRRAAVLMSATRAEDAPRTGWREHVKRQLVALFDAALVGGTPQRRYTEALGMPAHRIFEPYNVVDNAFFATAARGDSGAPGLQERTPFFLASGRFLAIKNLDGLLRAYAAYRAQISAPWRLVLLGDGAEREALEGQIRRERIEGVTVTGFRQIEELPAYYHRTGALVHPSFKDTWGLVVNEAMAAGLPVIVSTGAGCHEDLVRVGENGFTFDPGDLEALTQHLLTVSDPAFDRAAAGEASRRIVEEWSPERFAEGLWRAVQAGQMRANRSFPTAGRAILALLDRLARRPNAFHSVAD